VAQAGAPSSQTELLVAGSIALDTRDGPFGKLKDEVGGSALYFALAASLILPVTLIGVMGKDAVKRVERVLEGRPIDTSYLEVQGAPTYRWQAHQEHGRNVDMGSTDQIYDLWKPTVPRGFSGWAFVGSMRPDRQAQLMKLLAGARVLAADAMLSYVHGSATESKDVLRRAGWFFCNEDEFAALGGGDGEEFRRRWWLEGLVVKAGPGGVTAYTADGRFHVPALHTHPVIDTTGAGDAVAGGMFARWISTGGERGHLLDALMCGVACASLAIESIGIRGIATATPHLLEQRMAEVAQSLKPAS
jgi:sugar/nucleoside kinase (ribokinase family)